MSCRCCLDACSWLWARHALIEYDATVLAGIPSSASGAAVGAVTLRWAPARASRRLTTFACAYDCGRFALVASTVLFLFSVWQGYPYAVAYDLDLHECMGNDAPPWHTGQLFCAAGADAACDGTNCTIVLRESVCMEVGCVALNGNLVWDHGNFSVNCAHPQLSEYAENCWTPGIIAVTILWVAFQGLSVVLAVYAAVKALVAVMGRVHDAFTRAGATAEYKWFLALVLFFYGIGIVGIAACIWWVRYLDKEHHEPHGTLTFDTERMVALFILHLDMWCVLTACRQLAWCSGLSCFARRLCAHTLLLLFASAFAPAQPQIRREVLQAFLDHQENVAFCYTVAYFVGVYALLTLDALPQSIVAFPVVCSALLEVLIAAPVLVIEGWYPVPHGGHRSHDASGSPQLPHTYRTTCCGARVVAWFSGITFVLLAVSVVITGIFELGDDDDAAEVSALMTGIICVWSIPLRLCYHKLQGGHFGEHFTSLKKCLSCRECRTKMPPAAGHSSTGDGERAPLVAGGEATMPEAVTAVTARRRADSV